MFFLKFDYILLVVGQMVRSDGDSTHVPHWKTPPILETELSINCSIAKYVLYLKARAQEFGACYIGLLECKPIPLPVKRQWCSKMENHTDSFLKGTTTTPTSTKKHISLPLQKCDLWKSIVSCWDGLCLDIDFRDVVPPTDSIPSLRKVLHTPPKQQERKTSWDTVDGRTPAPVNINGKYSIIYRVSYMSGGAGSLPSTVS